jgi:hypothetical protein
MPTTDYHELIRNTIAEDLRSLGLGCNVETIDDVDDAARLTLPVCAVVCVGPEQNRHEMTTNQQDGKNYPCAVLLLTSGTTRGEKDIGPPSVTTFRRIVHNRYNNKRLSGVPQVGWCEVVDSGPLVDEKSPAFQRLQTALVVQAIGRFPRS